MVNDYMRTKFLEEFRQLYLKLFVHYLIHKTWLFIDELCCGKGTEFA